MRRNHLLLRALGLEQNDVYQELAIAALDAIDSFDPTRSEDIQAHIWVQLQYAILNIKRRYKPHGITGMDTPMPRFYSVELSEELGHPLPALAYELDSSDYRLRQAMARLEPQERSVVILYLDGVKPRRKAQICDLESALDKLRDFYLAVWAARGCGQV